LPGLPSLDFLPGTGKPWSVPGFDQSKGNKPWRQWITSSARHAPANRNVANLKQKIERLEAYEGWRKPIAIDYENAIGADEWSKHMWYLDQVLELLSQAETHAAICRKAVEDAATRNG
jgi:hypothetical protein